jgi:hypothetical protein
MNMHRTTLLLSVLAVGWQTAPPGRPAPQQREPVAERRRGAEQGVDIQIRGPVHEAFAEAITFDPEPGIVVRKEPPQLIEELPPAQRPEGRNVDWIPGYWSWDDEDNDFTWISGVWRSLPPGRQWRSGYWMPTNSGFQWISGYWDDDDLDEVEYLPEPPESVETGPSVQATAADQLWVPGIWVWHNGRYAWRAGYWAHAEPNWMWTPAHYAWSPRGYIFVDGYWDYPVERRGILFAPARFQSAVYGRPGFVYSPSVVIDLGLFTDHLFVRPRAHHYYFGDYYGANYASVGFYPWFEFHQRHYGYDPFFAYSRWHHRGDRDWENRITADFRNRRDHEDARPPRTMAKLQELTSRETKIKDKTVVVAESFDRFVKDKDRSQKFVALDEPKRKEIASRRQEFQKSGDERRRLESESSEKSVAKERDKNAPTRKDEQRKDQAERKDQVERKDQAEQRKDQAERKEAERKEQTQQRKDQAERKEQIERKDQAEQRKDQAERKEAERKEQTQQRKDQAERKEQVERRDQAERKESQQRKDQAERRDQAEQRKERTEPPKVKMPRSPISGRGSGAGEKPSAGEAPPKKYDSPKPDTTVEPKPRKPRDSDRPNKETPRKDPSGGSKDKDKDKDKSDKPKG